MKVRETSIKYGAKKKKNLETKQIEIERIINQLEKQLADTCIEGKLKEKIYTELEDKKRELEAYIEYQTKGAILRSKSRWYNEGEKNTAYFLNLEKRHCKQGTITQLKRDEHNLIYSDKEILSECKLFYENLYSSSLADANVFQETFFPVQENARKCLEALRDMMPEKTPSTDGLPCEFYKVFWNDLGEILIKALNYSHV